MNPNSVTPARQISISPINRSHIGQIISSIAESGKNADLSFLFKKKKVRNNGNDLQQQIFNSNHADIVFENQKEFQGNLDIIKEEQLYNQKINYKKKFGFGHDDSDDDIIQETGGEDDDDRLQQNQKDIEGRRSFGTEGNIHQSVLEIVKKGIERAGPKIKTAYEYKKELESKKPDKENLSVYHLIHKLQNQKTWKYMRVLIAFLKKKGPFWYSKRPLFYDKLAKALIDMNNQSVDGLEDVYHLTTFWPQDYDSSYPKYSELKTDSEEMIRGQPPWQTLTQKYYITEEEFQQRGNFAKCGLKLKPQGTHTTEARIAAWAIPMPVMYGSKKSLDMLKSLERCKNNEIFKIPILQGYLNYKWDQARIFLLIQAILHIIYLVAFNTYTISVSARDNWGLRIFILVMTSIFLGREVLQVFGRGTTYFADPWNYPDIGMVICIVIAVLRDQIDPDKQMRAQWLFVIGILLQWTRAISYFRLWHRTRHLIRSITETFHDMIPFILIVMVVVFAYTAAYICTYPKSQIDDFTYGGRMFEAYEIILGNPSQMNHNAPAYLVYIISSLAGLIILLNMLIALMGDTFGRVQENKVVYDYRERLSVNIDLESLMYCCKKNKDKLLHIGVIRRPGGFESGNEWEGQLTEVKKVVKKGISDTKRQIIKLQNVVNKRKE